MDIKKVMNSVTDENAENINWTKVWSSKYPVLGTYQREVDIKSCEKELSRILDSLEKTYHYSRLDAMLVLKDILAHSWKDKKYVKL